jgi:L-ascorbate metabolism protein UlaG (beta-lactamase superfamily)
LFGVLPNLLKRKHLNQEKILKIRYLGHSCVEIIGRHHILIDPDFTRDPEPGVEYICITHAHNDHIGRAVDVPDGIVLASADVCEIAASLGVPRECLRPVKPGEQIANIQVLPGYSRVNDPIYTFFYFLFRWRFPEPGGTPLSFLVQDEADLLHIGDAHEAPLSTQPDILCLPWRTTPFGPKRYKEILVQMATRFAAPYILPIHYDLPGTEADPSELTRRVHATVLEGNGWYGFHERKKED